MSDFRCISLSPIGLAHPEIAIATVRAGGIGILDLEHSRDAAIAASNLQRLIAQTEHSGNIGLRLKANQIESSLSLFSQFSGQSHWLILADWQALKLPNLLSQLSTHSASRILLEITHIEQVEGIALDPIKIEGLVARGYESGGWTGEDSAFILSQKVLQATDLPLYVQGGIGLHTAAACRAAGAAGVILDDQLWLMPESPFPETWQSQLKQLTGQEATSFGERLQAPLRVLARPGYGVISQLQQLLEQLELTNAEEQAWRQSAAPYIGWGSPGDFAWPMGQAVGLAAEYQARYRTTGRFIQALLNTSEQNIRQCQHSPLLSPDSPLALSHGTPYPIVQGPMTRVSDTADFADAIAKAGGLPMLALALMQKGQVADLLHQVQTQLGDRPWGVGLLGFVPQALRQSQIEVVKAIKPPFAIIAGGRPDQAAQLEAEGIATYIHVPSPKLLQLFLEQGARRFIFEGFECGGHVGPLSSFVLWESMIQVLLNQVPRGQDAKVHVLFAGGIHDACSAAMVSAMAAPLGARGMRIGVLMGSAYLFTQEAVACGAIVEGFQQQALTCTRTINLETGPGHASRCAMTPFAQEFYDTRRRMLAAGHSAEEIKTTLEDLTLGRLRVASKGLLREAEGLSAVDASAQQTDGMYMLGQVATLRNQVGTLKELHQQVSVGSHTWLSQRLQVPERSHRTSKAADIAIIGIGTLLPKAKDPDRFWQNILNRVSAISEIPSHRWDWQLYYSADRRAQDKVYSKWGGFLEAIPFDPMRFGIPPKSLQSIEPAQLLTLEAVRQALIDAGYDEESEFDREHTSVILGASGGLSDLGQQYATRCEIPRMVAHPDQQVWDRLPEWTEESFPGILLNVIAGRSANRFNLGGSNFTVDAACASSLAALDVAVQELESGRCSMAIAGGVDTLQSAFTYFCFSKTHALSPQGVARSFDQAADGIVISEGVAVVVLKRLADAQRDGDRIYGVIKAVASSSDGKGLSMTAPASSGQQRALRRAYEKAGFSAATLGLYEAHGTGTSAGDRAELQTIRTLLQESQAAANACAVGSVKTLIGHTKSTAGMAALVKAVLALYHRVLPPHTNVENPLEGLQGDTPTYLLKEAQPWLTPTGHPRRAGVSAFGFGGTNFHAVLEEYIGSDKAPLGATHWPCELMLFPAATQAQLPPRIRPLLASLVAGAEPPLADLAYTLAQQCIQSPHQPVGLAIVVHDLAQLQAALAQVEQWLEQGATSPLPPHIQVHPAIAGKASGAVPGKVAFLFPGQGAQYPDMAREMALFCPELRQAVEVASQQLQGCFSRSLSQLIYPPAAYTEADQAATQAALTHTQVAQPAIGAISAGYLQLIRRLGVQADMAAGHSYGEYTALYASGVLSQAALFHLSETRGRVMAAALAGAGGAMAAVMANRETLLDYLAEEPDVVLANHNAPQQSVISGAKAAIGRVVTRLQTAGITVQPLPVAGAFHSPLVESARVDLADAIASVDLELPQIPVYSNVTAQPYTAEKSAIRTQLSQHLTSSVEFVSQIQAMYADGARTFVELGPKSILTKLVGQILGNEDHLAVSFDHRSGLAGFLQSLASLAIRGVSIDWANLYHNRSVCSLNLNQLVATCQSLPPTAQTWWLDGGSVRRGDQSVGYFGKQPPLDQKTVLSQATVTAASKIAVPLPGATAVNSPTNGLIKATNGSTNGSVKAVKGASSPSSPGESDSLFSLSANSIEPRGALPPMNVHPSSQSDYPPVPRPVAEETVLSAYQAYQETMRQFLSLQETVMGQFLQTMGGLPTPLSGAADRAPVLSPTPSPAANSHSHHLLGVNGDILPGQNVHSEMFNAAPADLVDVLTPGVTAEALMTPSVSYPIPIPQVSELTAVNPPVTESATLAPLDRAALVELLLTLVSDRTGYPPDMLGLDQDMEADLGIDSIKRVEIFGAMQKRLPPDLAALVQSEIEHFTRVKTLNGLVDALLAGAPTVSTPVAPVLEAHRLGKPEGATDLLSRYVMEARLEPLASSPVASLSGLILITSGRDGELAAQVTAQLQQAGAYPAVLSPVALADPDALTVEVAGYRQQFGPVQGILHLAGATPRPLPETLRDWRQQTQQQSKSLFYLLQACGEDLRCHQGIVLAASLLGGYFGRDGRCGPGLPTAGSNNGLLKTLMLEWPEVRAATLDLDADVPVAEVATCLLQEMRSHLPDAEVGYPQGQRTVFYPVRLPLASHSADSAVEPTANWVVLAIGGARGITAEVLKALLVPGMTLILVGRTIPPATESAATQGIDDLGQLRQVLVQQARTEGQQTTPAQIEKQVRQLQRDRAIRSNLAAFRQAGVTVEYRALDLQAENSEENVRLLMQEIYEHHGHLDAVLQGAGIIEDKLLLDKHPDSFERVFDTKVDSTFLLTRYLRPESLKLVVLFASVAGRSGNRGQADYAAANEVVNRFAWWMQQHWPGTRTVAINWGPWDMTGMASDEVNRQFRDRGVIPIPPNAGCQYILQELRCGQSSEAEVVVGLFEEVPQEKNFLDISEFQPLSAIGIGGGPLLTQSPQTQPDGSVILDQMFSLASDPYLRDHCLDGQPVMAAAAAQEWLAEFVQAAWPDWVVCEVRNLRVLRGIVLKSEGGEPIRLIARASTHASYDALEVAAEIVDPVEKRSFYRATVVLRPQLEPPPLITWLPLEAGETLDVAMAYRRYCFHGPLFQCIVQLPKVSEQGADALVQASHPTVWLGRPSETRSWLFDPGLIDASLQMGLIFARIQGDTSGLPGRFGQVVRYRTVAPDEVLTVYLRIKTFTPMVLIYDAVFVDQHQQVCLQLTDIESTCSKALNRLASS